jgi:DNA-binding transcriptional ArsR family regulator
MHEELAAAVAGVLAGATKPAPLTRAQKLVLVRAANLATKARTAVEVDFRGDVEDAHASEAPTRLAKQLAQVVRGAAALGIDPLRAMQLAIRCAGDSLPPMRLAILNDLADVGVYMPSTAGDVAKRIDKPRRSVDRQLQALHALGLATVKPDSSPWDYSLRAGINPKVLDPKCCAEMLVDAHRHIEESESEHEDSEPPPTHISAHDSPSPNGQTGRGATPAHCGCGEELLTTESIARGLCRECRMFGPAPADRRSGHQQLHPTGNPPGRPRKPDHEKRKTAGPRRCR